MSDVDVVSLEIKESSIVVVPSGQVITTVVQEPSVVVVQEEQAVAIDFKETVVVSVGQQGPRGRDGAGATGLFILDVTPTSSGIVGNKEYEPDTVPASVEIVRCDSDTTNVRVHIGCEGGSSSYSPNVLVNGVPVALVESATKRWFTGYADIVLQVGENTVSAVSDTLSVDTAVVNVLGQGPDVLSIVFGPYPGVQTELKAGDIVQVTIATDPEATHVSILNAGATAGTTLAVVGGVASGPITISSASGSQTITAKARNSFGTYGQEFVSTALTLNQTYPTIGTISGQYPAGQTALKGTETATVSAVVLNFDTISYTSSDLLIDNPTTYSIAKTVTNSYTGYRDDGTNYTISATRVANGATTTQHGLVSIASVASLQSISISGNPSRLLSSAAGVDYTVQVTPNQICPSEPSLSASIGAWQGSWSYVSGKWQRVLRITDTDAKGAGVFSALSITNKAGIVSNAIISGSTYNVGGFVSRVVTFPAFSRVAPIGTFVVDQTKTAAQIVGGNVLTRYTDNAVHANGYYIANADGSYNPSGNYLGLSDSAFAGSNTTGTLQASIQESA